MIQSIGDIEIELEVEIIVDGEIDYDYQYFSVEAEYDYQPEEKEVMYYEDGSGYPGCAAGIEGIYDITCVDKDLILIDRFKRHLENEKTLKDIEDQIETQIWESLENEY